MKGFRDSKIKLLSPPGKRSIYAYRMKSQYIRALIEFNYGHDDFSVGLLRDTTPDDEIQLMIYGATHPFLWNHARFFLLLRPMRMQKYIKHEFCNILPTKLRQRLVKTHKKDYIST